MTVDIDKIETLARAAVDGLEGDTDEYIRLLRKLQEALSPSVVLQLLSELRDTRRQARGYAPFGNPTALPLEEWHEDIGTVLWWRFPINEPPYCGTPLDDDWPEYHTHWTRYACPFWTKL